MHAATESLLREAALSRLAEGESEAAVDLAGRLVQLERLNGEHRALLQRSLSARGEPGRAAAAGPPGGYDAAPVARARATHQRVVQEQLAPVHGRALAQAQLDAGQAAIAGGAFERGVACLRRAVTEAGDCGAGELETAALIALGAPRSGPMLMASDSLE